MTIGETLAEAREKAGLSVDQVAAATRIRRTLVIGIERDDFSACGGDFYARGHIRTIAQTVGVEARPLLAQFDANHPGSAPPRASDVFESETGARPERRGPNWSAAMAAALVLVVVYGVFQLLSGGEEPVDDVTADRGRGGPTSQVAAEPSPSPSPSAAQRSAVAQAPREKVTVAVRARGTSWVKATADDGEELFEGLLEDETRTFTDRSRIVLVIGNAGVVSLTVNGSPVGNPGDRGQVARVDFTPEDPAGG